MAAQNEKIPSPSELKKEPFQFSNEEITQLRNLQAEIQQVTIQFGQFHLAKLRLEEQEVLLKDKLSELQKQELTLAKSLSNKYGEGSLDIETGTFTPSK